jgi:hypothetical protein
MTLRTLALAAGAAAALAAQPAPVTLSNDKIEVAISPVGGRMTALKLHGAESLGPLAAMGHFLALDGFGAPSEQERAVGTPFHGEASGTVGRVTASNAHSLTLELRLPLAEETLLRTYELAEGENVVTVTSELESLAGFDRPVSWAEHATLGMPYLEPGKVVIDMPATRCRVRAEKAGSTGKLAYLKDFTWPMAPLTAGGTVNLLTIPPGEKSLDLAACLIDPARAYGYITAVRPDKRLLFGYLFRRADFPWVMNWMNYTGDARAPRGTEFSTQPFDVSHRETVDAHEMFGEPTYHWLPAKSKIRARFQFFYCELPAGFGDVADVTPASGRIEIRDKSGRVLALKSQASVNQ